MRRELFMKSSKKVLHLFIVLTMMSIFMFGCGKTEVPADTNTEKENVVAEAPETTTAVEETQQETVEVALPK